MRDTAPGLQTLWVRVSLGKGARRVRDRDCGCGPTTGSARASSPAAASGGSQDGGRRYVGIADPRTARVLVDPAHGPSKTASVHQGFYSFALPKGSGHVDLREVDAAGATVRDFPLRG